MRRLGYRPQRTLTHPISLTGTGFLAGERVRIRLRPAPANTGLMFHRTDSRVPLYLAACSDQVTGTRRRTTIGYAPRHVSLVEHVLAALSGLRIDNCLIELDGNEPPGFDGSSREFVNAIQDAGITTQSAKRAVWTVDQPITVSQGHSSLTIHPAESDELRISYLLDYGSDSPITRQNYTLRVSPEAFSREVAHCRTFVLEHEAVELQRQGIGRHIGPEDVLVFGPRGLIDNQLQYADEPARHKVLDIIGDMALFGFDLRGHIVACRSGHPLNVELVRTLSRRLIHFRPVSFLRAA